MLPAAIMMLPAQRLRRCCFTPDTLHAAAAADIIAMLHDYAAYAICRLCRRDMTPLDAAIMAYT